MPHDLLATGTITDANLGTNNTYQVVVDSDGATLPGCQSVVGGFFAPLLGLRANYKHSVGANVLLLRTSPALILCELPSSLGTPVSSKAASVTTADTDSADLDQQANEKDPTNQAFREKRDLLAGELDLSNALQVGIVWLTHMLKVQAGDRVKIELHLIDDLLRIMSENLQVITGAGDWRCVNDGGQVTMRKEWTSYEHEAWGLLSARDPKIKTAEGGLPSPQDVPETGRWRCTEFSGALADMVHSFITDPAEALGSLAQERAGKHREWVGADGSHIIQSVGDIVLERVVRVVVPIELKRSDDPTGDTVEDMQAPKADFLDIWKPDPAEPWTMAYHLRDYARWLSNYAGYARFLQRKKDWLVKAEADTPEPKLTAGQKDREMAVPASLRVPRTTYACIRIMRDGSIVTLNGYGCSHSMIGPDIVASAVRDYRIEAGRNVVITAGHSIFAKARNNIELVAVLGAFIASSKARMALWCEKGTLLLRTLMRAEDAPAEGIHRFSNRKVGLIMEAPFARAVVAGKQATVEASDTDDSMQDPALRLQSAGNATLRSGRNKVVGLAGGKLTTMFQELYLVATSLIRLAARDIDFGSVLMKTGAKLVARQLQAESLVGKSIINGQLIQGGSDNHRNHVVYSGAAAKISMPESAQLPSDDYPSALSPGLLDAKLARPVCDYLPPNTYQARRTHESLTQQFLRSNLGQVEEAPQPWQFSDDAADGDSAATHKKPYPGDRSVVVQYVSEANLHQPSTQAPEEFKPAPSKQPEEKPATFFYP